MNYRYDFRKKTVTFKLAMVLGSLLILSAVGFVNPTGAEKISRQFSNVEAMYSDAKSKENPRQIKEARQIYHESISILEDILESPNLSIDEKFYAEYLLAFVYYHVSLVKADSLFGKLREAAIIAGEDSLVTRTIRDWIIRSSETVFLDMQGKIEKQKAEVLDQLVSTYLNRGIIYEKVRAIIPLIALTREMYLIVQEGQGDQEKFNDALNEIQKRQQRITEHLGPESRK